MGGVFLVQRRSKKQVKQEMVKTEDVNIGFLEKKNIGFFLLQTSVRMLIAGSSCAASKLHMSHRFTPTWWREGTMLIPVVLDPLAAPIVWWIGT